jgi:hypothetical protein
MAFAAFVDPFAVMIAVNPNGRQVNN